MNCLNCGKDFHLLENILQIRLFTGKYSPILTQTDLLMENILPRHLQEIIFSSSDPSVSKQISKLEKAGKIKKIAARFYTPNFTESPEAQNHHPHRLPGRLHGRPSPPDPAA